jgi:hypothetical protein
MMLLSRREKRLPPEVAAYSPVGAPRPCRSASTRWSVVGREKVAAAGGWGFISLGSNTTVSRALTRRLSEPLSRNIFFVSKGVGGFNHCGLSGRNPLAPYGRIFFPIDRILRPKLDSRRPRRRRRGQQNRIRPNAYARCDVLRAIVDRRNRVFNFCRHLTTETAGKIVAKFGVGGGGCLISLVN